jgi:hypothetical protein
MPTRSRLKRSSKERFDAQVKSNRLKRIKWGSNDLIQEFGKLRDIPEFRVWVHPVKGGDDYFFAFRSLNDAKDWSAEHQGDPKYKIVESPLIAFMGSEGTVSGFRKEFPRLAKEYL